jgi:hypothetical protein
LTRTTAILALGCFLVVGAAAASILGWNSVPAAGPEIQPPVNALSSNKENKRDKLPLVVAALAPPEADQILPPTDRLRLAFAPDGSADVNIQAPAITAPVEIPSVAAPAQKPRLAARPPLQKTYTLLSDAQIAAIKGRLNLTAAQEQYWPSVESALRAIAHKMHETRQANPRAGSPPIDPDCAEVQQLKSVAMPLLVQLREDQKREVRSLARIIGLESVASLI